jgi:hypothetical protein
LIINATGITETIKILINIGERGILLMNKRLAKHTIRETIKVTKKTIQVFNLLLSDFCREPEITLMMIAAKAGPHVAIKTKGTIRN